MSNKNTKKRRRIVMTSDVVPAGTRDDVTGQEIPAHEVAPGEEVTGASAAETSSADGEGVGPTPNVSVEVNGQVLVRVSPERRRRLARKTQVQEDEGGATREGVSTPAADADREGEEPVRASDAEDARADESEEDAERAGDDDEEAVARGGDDDADAASDGDAASDADDAEETSARAAEGAALADPITGDIDPQILTATDVADDEVTEPGTQGELWVPEETEPPATTVPAADLSRAHLKGLIEALVFVSDQPLTINDLSKAAGKADRKLVKALAEELRQDYARRGIHLDEVAGGLIFRTNPAYGPFIRDAAAKKPVRMTRAQLETLSIIAYRQPLTRPEVDEVRGVDSGPVMKMLLERDLIKILGKKDEPGRPLLYGTTHTFLEFFGLKALKDLPSLREFTELSDDSRRTFDREMGDVPTETDLSALAAAASAAGPAPVVEPTAEPSSEASADVEPSTMRAPETGDDEGDTFAEPAEPNTSVDELDTVPSEGAAASSDAATSDDDVAEASSDAPESDEEGVAEASSDAPESDEEDAAEASARADDDDAPDTEGRGDAEPEDSEQPT